MTPFWLLIKNTREWDISLSTRWNARRYIMRHRLLVILFNNFPLPLDNFFNIYALLHAFLIRKTKKTMLHALLIQYIPNLPLSSCAWIYMDNFKINTNFPKIKRVGLDKSSGYLNAYQKFSNWIQCSLVKLAIYLFILSGDIVEFDQWKH